MPQLNADLHSHSCLSDGTLQPEAVAQRAAANGVQLWALTDHDELGSQARARDAAQALKLPYLHGVEVSVSFAGETIHIVGLGVDPLHAGLGQGLASIRSGRTRRAQDMADGLAQAGHPGALEGAMAYAGNPELVSRTHFARWMVERGICADTGSVFRRFLTPGKPGYVPHRWASLGQAVGWIRGASGVAVIAHPARYRLTVNEEFALFSEFKTHGGQGVEVLTASHGASDVTRVAELAREFGLLASCGSDFHDPHESRIDLGGLPPLPAGLTPVWQALTARVMS